MNKNHFSKAKKEKVWKKTNGLCYYCGIKMLKVFPSSYSEFPLHVFTIDHVIPKISGGTNFIGNLVPACFNCNIKKRDSIDHLFYSHKC